MNHKLTKKIAETIIQIYNSNLFILEPLSVPFCLPEYSALKYSDWVSFKVEKFNFFAQARLVFSSVRFTQSNRLQDKDHYCPIHIEPRLALEYQINAQALYIIEKNIEDKYKKISNVPSDQKLLPKWLAIINREITIDVNDFQEAFFLLNPTRQSMFDKVFIIDFDQQAHELIKKL